jgi:hypothetical protein
VPSDTRFPGSSRACLLLAALVFTAPALAQRGGITAPRNLEQMTASAADIVRGTVLSARVEKHPELTHLDTLVVTLKVHDTLKGSANGTFAFRQYIWDVRDREDAAGYLKGREFLLLLNAPSRYGLTSPVGMEQGRFRVLRDASGRQVAVNGRGNALLMRGVAGGLAQKGLVLSPASASLATRHQQGPIAVDELEQLIRELAGKQG